MKMVLMIFLLSLGVALLITPMVALVARRFNLVDKPSGRKVHTKPIPRIGGVAIYLAFFGPFLGILLYPNDLISKILSEQSLLWVSMGATLVFLMGLADDIFRLRPLVKFGVQAIAALIAYVGGVDVIVGSFGWLALPVTLFWFLLVINAVNLIDGLDGLAAGVTLFVSLVLLVLCILGGKLLVAAGLAALVGACLGFLRYNFNPASIFMGDGGSYFLGYMLASLSILGSMKSQATVAILIPVIALGLPLMDTVLAPVRRFLIGKELFQPDKSHIHHKLLKMGFSHRNTVLLLYGATILLGISALMLVNAHDQRAAFILLVVGVSVIVGIHKLGYLEYLAVDKMIGYLHDVTDEMGLKKDRRTFLNRQIAISETLDTDELWERIIDALELLGIDQAEIRFNGVCFEVPTDADYKWCGRELKERPGQCQHRVMSLDLPLADDQNSYGTLHMRKDLMLDPISHYTLRRIEHLRRSIVRKLKTFEDNARIPSPKPEIECEGMSESKIARSISLR